jgi:hypothetical protein
VKAAFLPKNSIGTEAHHLSLDLPLLHFLQESEQSKPHYQGKENSAIDLILKF